MKRIFKMLSGRPKSGDIVECINPFIFVTFIIIACIIMFIGFISNNIAFKFIWSITAVIISWQTGWGMSIERFVNDEELNKRR